MTSQLKKRSILKDGISDEAVAHYLERHPEFFERNAELLAQLRVPHMSGGQATSLVEKQVDILRQRNRKLEAKLVDLVEVARANTEVSDKIHQLAVRLLAISSAREIIEMVEASLREDFEADMSMIVLFGQGDAYDALPRTHYFRTIGRDDPAIRAFATFMATGKPRCGHLRDAQRDFLFGDNNAELGSAALIPLGDHASLGLLAIGSRDENHFNPSMGTDLLTRIGELVGTVLGASLGR